MCSLQSCPVIAVANVVFCLDSFMVTAHQSVEEMLKEDGPDWHKVLCYVESIFHHFEMEVPTTQSVDYVTAT